MQKRMTAVACVTQRTCCRLGDLIPLNPHTTANSANRRFSRKNSLPQNVRSYNAGYIQCLRRPMEMFQRAVSLSVLLVILCICCFRDRHSYRPFIQHNHCSKNYYNFNVPLDRKIITSKLFCLELD